MIVITFFCEVRFLHIHICIRRKLNAPLAKNSDRPITSFTPPLPKYLSAVSRFEDQICRHLRNLVKFDDKTLGCFNKNKN